MSARGASSATPETDTQAAQESTRLDYLHEVEHMRERVLRLEQAIVEAVTYDILHDLSSTADEMNYSLRFKTTDAVAPTAVVRYKTRTDTVHEEPRRT
jgi:hypothetical protein